LAPTPGLAGAKRDLKVRGRRCEALGLWRGAPLADFGYESFAQISIERLDEIRLATLEQRIEAELALGRHKELVGELEQFVAEHPLHERLRAQLMLALYRSGRQGEALEVYRKTRARSSRSSGSNPLPGSTAVFKRAGTWRARRCSRAL
jgi:DNA-binding SARP family transcriptional activator